LVGASAGWFFGFTANEVEAKFADLTPVEDQYLVAIGQTVPVELSSTPGTLLIDSITAESSKPKILKVKGSGSKLEIEGISEGEAEVVVESKIRGASQVYEFRVSEPPTEIDGLPESLTLGLDEKLELRPEVLPEGSAFPVSYSSNDEAVVTVSPAGEVAAQAKGHAVITASCVDIQVEVDVTVTVDNPYMVSDGPAVTIGSVVSGSMVFGEPVPNCTGLSLVIELTGGSSDALKNSDIDVYVNPGSGAWTKAGTFTMGSSDIGSGAVTFEAQTVASVTIAPTGSFSGSVSYRQMITNVYFHGDTPAADT
jgi:hypothetical protein